MTKEDLLDSIGTYRKFFLEQKIEAADYPHEELLTNSELGLQHCHGMLDKMVVFVEQGRLEKAFRWLGFIQGVLWASSVFRLQELKDHNAPIADTGV